MNVEIVKESVAVLPDYGRISIAFMVESQLRVEPVAGGLGGLRLVKEKVEKPYVRDFDEDDESPADWLNRWETQHWGIFSAFDGLHRVGGVVIAWRTPGMNMLEGREDLAVIWDIRVDRAYRRQGVGAKLFGRAANWARDRECKLLKVESQNINVAACRFYAGQGCELGTIRRWAYPDAPNEVQLLWYLEIE